MSDGTQVEVIASGSEYGPIGSAVTLSAQVATQKIGAGEVEYLADAPSDGQQVQILEAGYGYDIGDAPTLAASVATDFIARGIATAL